MTPSTRVARAEVAMGIGAIALAATKAAWEVIGVSGSSDGPSYVSMVVVFTVVYALTGTVLAWHGVAPVIRRLLLAVALVQGISGLAATWSDHALTVSPPLPGGELAQWLGSWMWAPAYVAIPTLLPALLPDGRPRWRWLPWLAGLAVSYSALSWALTPYELQDFPIEGGYRNPVGVELVASTPVVAAGGALIIATVGCAVASLVARYRSSSGLEREQLRWLVLGVLGTVAVGALGFALPQPVAELMPALAVIPFPAALLVALLRTRLWDIDLVLSRSLTYATLSACAVGTYVVAVSLLGTVAGDRAGAPVLATALVALMVLPLHTRLQRLVNRLVHGDDVDPYTALSQTGARLEAAQDPAGVADLMLPELVVRISRALRTERVAVELSDSSRVGDEHLEATGATEVALVYGGLHVGRLLVGTPDVQGRDRRVLEALARQAAVAVHAMLMAREARAARTAAAAAREEERLRLRRDLHDGLGPVLAAAALQTETARELMTTHPEQARTILERLSPRLNEAVVDVRALTHALRPPSLDGLGLAGSVHELATRFATPDCAIHVEAGQLGQLPAAVDVAAYRIVAEAVTNAARHARAHNLHLSLLRTCSELEVRICDDGIGLPDVMVPGVGLRSMKERAEELGGSCGISSQPDSHGTTVLARLPLPEEA
ncbi:MAG: sensor histidine kinase [Nocardioides sp.]